MILNEYIILKTKGLRKKQYYKDLGYDISKEEIKINIEHLTTGSRELVKVKCDYCNIEKEITFKQYKKSTEKINKWACSQKCGSKKTKELHLKKWGVESPMMLKETQEKVKQTNLERRGVEWAQQSNKVKNKSKLSNLEKWGVDHYSKTNEYKESVKKTNLERRGVEWPTQSKEVRDKCIETLIENWGVDNPSKNKEIQEKKKITSKINWKTEHPMQSNIIKNKIKYSYNLNFGFDHPMQSEEVINKIKQTNLENWGVEFYIQSDDFKGKFKESMMDKFGVENALKSQVIKEKVKQTNLERWGNEEYFNSDDFKEKSKQTLISNWGNESISKSELFRKIYKNIAKDTNYVSYLGNNISLFKCDLDKDHLFEIKGDNYFSRNKSKLPLCTVCNPIGDSVSIKENELYEYINSIYSGKIIQSYRDGLEIDIYLPELKIGFEFNGLYWHSEKYKDKWYHINKSNYFKDKGIRVIHIWEDDWDFKGEIIKSQIRNWLGLNNERIFARKCEFKELKDIKIVKKFLNDNHVQGWVRSSLKLGLYHNGELVSVMLFDHNEGRDKMSNNEWNLSRFCNKLGTNVVGGASKLLKNFIKEYSVTRIISYADKDWSSGNLYEKLGFELVKDNNPDYKYIVDNKRVHKSRFKKANLNTELSEANFMKKHDIPKLWDCGKLKYEILI